MSQECDGKVAKKAAFDAYRHEQTVKRWLTNNTKKPSKIIYASDFLEYGPGAAALDSATGEYKGPPRRRRWQKVLLPGTRYHPHHQWTRRGDASKAGPTSVPSHTRHKAGKAHQSAKQRNPHSEVPYNHRKKWTKLKRTIFDTRKRAFESQAADSAPDDVDSEAWQDILTGIQQMEALYAGLDAAIQHHQLRHAAILRQRLRRKRLQLQRECRQAVASDAQEVVERNAATQEAPRHHRAHRRRRPHQGYASGEHADAVPTVYSNFYPSTTLLKVGQHPRQTAVDRRTGRYPRLLPADAVQTLARTLADESLSTTATSDSATAAPECVAMPTSNRLFLGAYCRNVLDDTMEDLIFTLLQSLYAEQREVRQKQPLQFKARQRYVVGLQETIKFLRAARVKLVLLAGDMEVVESEAESGDTPAVGTAGPKRKFQTLKEAVSIVHELCSASIGPSPSASVGARVPVPCVCCMTRQRLSYALFAKGSKISCVGILHSDKHPQLLRAAVGYSQKCLRRYAVAAGEAGGEEPAM